ncbi:Opacity-related protein POPM3, partial [Neisseria gonorrhoeae]
RHSIDSTKKITGTLTAYHGDGITPVVSKPVIPAQAGI